MSRSLLTTPLFARPKLLIAAMAGLAAACGEPPHPPHIDPNLRAEPIALLESAEGPIQVDQLLFRAGFRLEADSERFGGFSGLEFSPNGSEILAVGDRGFWLQARTLADSEGTLTGLDDVLLGPLKDLDGSSLDHQHRWDSEEVVFLSPTEVLITFEHDHRAYRYSLDEDGRPTGPVVPLTVPQGLLRAAPNQGLETATLLPDGRLMILTEGLLDERGDRIGWFGGTGDAGWETFTLASWEELQPTSATTLPDGRIVVLERSYSPEVGNRIRLSVFAASDLVPGARINPRQLGFLAAPMTLDNMEALASSQGPGGETFLYLLSDDNFSSKQRTLLLQFELLPEEETPLQTQPE